MKNKKEKIPDKFKKLVIDSIKQHAWLIGVSVYTGGITYMEKDEGYDGRGFIEAEMIISTYYLEFTLQIYPTLVEKWHEKGNDYVEKVIAHEVAHLATERLYDLAQSRFAGKEEIESAKEICTEIIGRLSYKLNLKNKKLK